MSRMKWRRGIRLSGVTGVSVLILAGILGFNGCKKVTGSDVPNPPYYLQVTAESVGSVILTWADNSDDEDGFVIELDPPGSVGFSDHATVGAGVTTFTVTGLEPDENYRYRVHAYNGRGSSDPTFTVIFRIYGTNVGNIAEDFSAQNQNNALVSLYSYEGNVILLNFAASW